MKKKSKKQKRNDEHLDSDDTFYFIAGYTEGGVPFGTTREEVVEHDLTLRQAKKKDANEAATLIHLAIDDIAEQLTGQTKKENIQKTLASFFREENNRLSYQNVIVADIYDEVAGIMIAYEGGDALQLDEPILKRLRKKRWNENIYFDKEANEEDFYIDTISVNPNFQGFGIGRKLIAEAEIEAMHKGYRRISLNVAFDNPNAKRLYKKLGYKEEKVIQINGHDYDYMVKMVDRQNRC